MAEACRLIPTLIQFHRWTDIEVTRQLVPCTVDTRLRLVFRSYVEEVLWEVLVSIAANRRRYTSRLLETLSILRRRLEAPPATSMNRGDVCLRRKDVILVIECLRHIFQPGDVRQ